MRLQTLRPFVASISTNHTEHWYTSDLVILKSRLVQLYSVDFSVTSFCCCCCCYPFSPNTSSSSCSPTEDGLWKTETSGEHEKRTYIRNLKGSRSCKSKRRKTPVASKRGDQDSQVIGIPGVSIARVGKEPHCIVNEQECHSLGTSQNGTQRVQVLRKLRDHVSEDKMGPYDAKDHFAHSRQGPSWVNTEQASVCSCSDSSHHLTASDSSSDEQPHPAGYPVSIPGSKSKRRKRWTSSSGSSRQSNPISPHISSCGEISDLEPGFIPNLTFDSMELSEENQFQNVILQLSEACLEEEEVSLITFVS